MSLPDGIRKLPTPMLGVFVVSKLILGIGIGVVLAQYLAPAGWWLIIIGLVLSRAAMMKIISLR